MRKLTAAAVVAVVMICVPLARAATSSPTVAASAPTSIADTAATLHGTINPNGLATTYQFEYGTSTSLGMAVPATAASAGAGTAGVAKSNRVGGLSPDTTYYYELVATNSAGTSTTPIATFQTTGNPAPGVTTNPAVGIGRYGATLDGTIAPNNQATTYYFQYGQTTSYGFQTGDFTLPAGNTPTPVAVALSGLSPGTVFHYRLVATHGPTSTTLGADAAFQTLPWPRPHTQVTLAVTPHTAQRTPMRVRAAGSVVLPDTIAPALGCHGKVWIRYYAGSRQVALSKARVAPNCSYSATTLIRWLGFGRFHLSVRAHYRGDIWAAPADAKHAAVVITPPAPRRHRHT